MAFRFLRRNKPPKIERQELWCHACDNHVQFDLDVNKNGKHVLECPKCKHEHCRIVINGKITDERWAQRNGVNLNTIPTYSVTAATTTYSSNSQWQSISFNSGTASTTASSNWP